MALRMANRRRSVERAAAASRRTGSRGRPPEKRWWWGTGPSPTERWPSATVDIPAVWSTTRDRWESHDGKYFLDEDEGNRSCEFFPLYLKHHIGEFAGRPFELLDYQRLLLTRPLFGWKRSSDGLRRFRKVFAFLPKGAGKSPWAAGTGLYLTLCDHEPAAEVYALAADKLQARTVHSNAKIMVEESPDLDGMCDVLKDAIYAPSTRSTYQVLSSDAATKHGFRPHGAIFDEFHAQKNRDLYEALKKSMVKRRQPMMLLISHAGADDEGICYEEYEYAKGVLNGLFEDDACLPVIFEMKPEDDWTSPEVWRRVNPGHGVTVQTEGIAAECREAQAEPRKLNDFLRFHGNRWVNQAVAWIPVDWWDACKDPMPSDDELRQHPCAYGIDMAQKIDLAAGVALFRLPLERADGTPDEIEVATETETGALVKRRLSLDYRIAVVPNFWLPEDTLRERVRNDHVPYDRWREEKLLTAVEGAIVTSEPIVRAIVGRLGGQPGLVDRFPLLKEAQFGYDPAFATEVAARLRDDHQLTVIEVLQNYKHLSEACQVFEALVKAKRIVHGGNRLLRWNLENVAIKRDDAGRIRPVKPKKATKRIDGIVALIIALSRLMLIADAAGSSEASRDFEERGLFGGV